MTSPSGQDKTRLRIALAITASFMIIEIAAGLWSGSLALVADAGHMLTDAGGLALSLLVLWLGEKPPTPKRTFGYRRTEILAALGNGLALWVTVGIIAQEAIRRFRHPPEIVAGPMLWVAVFGLIANLTTAWVLKGREEHGHTHNLNMRSAYLHVLADSWGSVGVIVAALIVAKTGYLRADPIVSLLICALILYSSWGLVKESLLVLLEATPRHIDVLDIEKALGEIDGVRGVHDLHVWTVTSGFDLLSGHLVIDEAGKQQYVLRAAKHALHTRFGISHSTIQIELPRP